MEYLLYTLQEQWCKKYLMQCMRALRSKKYPCDILNALCGETKRMGVDLGPEVREYEA